MTLTAIDPVCALVAIDLQKGIIAMPGLAHPIADILQNTASLAAAFRERGLPVVLVNVAGRAPGRTEARSGAAGQAMSAEWIELADELHAAPTDLRVTKHVVGAFHGTELDALLRDRGVTQVVLTGVATTMGVEGTARAAHEHGYNVVLATDAMTDRSLEAHLASVNGIFPRIGETATTTEILQRLAAH